MAERPIFIAKNSKPYYRTMIVSFPWNGGFAKTQSQKNIRAMHKEYSRFHPEGKILEISSKSEQDLGIMLSAFNLMIFVPSLGKKVPLECVFQAGKIFSEGGPYTDLLEALPKNAKRDERLKTSGKIVGFAFEGVTFPSEPKTAFYDWMYYKALKSNPSLLKELSGYDAFTDIAFNPEKSLNCQARTAAKLAGIIKAGELHFLDDFESFLKSY